MLLATKQHDQITARIKQFDHTASHRCPKRLPKRSKSAYFKRRQHSTVPAFESRDDSGNRDEEVIPVMIVQPTDPTPEKASALIRGSDVDWDAPRTKSNSLHIKKKPVPEPPKDVQLEFESKSVHFTNYSFKKMEKVDTHMKKLQRQRSTKERGSAREVGEVRCRIWRVDNRSTFVYPELADGDTGITALKEKLNFGVAVSGGSMRAMCCGLGWLRGLEMIGVLNQARYLSSNSGGSMVSCVYSFQDHMPTPQLLGPYMPPENCTLKLLSQHKAGCALGGVFARAKHLIRRFMAAVIEGKIESALPEAFSNTFLAPFNLDDVRGIMGVGGVSSTAAGVRQYTVDSSRPFPIINCSIILPNDPFRFHPFEFTPLYCGSVARRNYEDREIGGCLMEPIGFNCNRPADLDDLDLPEGHVTCPPHDLVCLQGMVGASASFLSVAMQEMEIFDDLPFAQEFSYWSPHSKHTHKLPFADGGGVDNLGIMSLLRRHVSRIISLVATLETDFITPGKDYMMNMADVAMLFGQVPPELEIFAVNGPHLNERNQVFPTGGFTVIQEDLAEKQRRGLPLRYCGTFQVLENKFHAIEGGWEVSVMFVFNAPCKKWEEQLPKETQARLERDRTSAGIRCIETKCTPGTAVSLHEFPCVSTMEFKYSGKLVAMMGNMSSWMILDARDEIRTLLTTGFGAPQY